MNDYRAETLHFKLDQGLDSCKLLDYSDLAYDISKYRVSASEAFTRLQKIATQTPLFSIPTQLVAFGVASCCASLLFFGGSSIDAVFAFFFGCIVGALCIFLDAYPQFKALLSFFTAFLVSFFAFAISTATSYFCPFSTALAGIVWLLPGLSIAIAVAELSARCIISGSSRFFGAVIIALQQGFGLALGSRFVLWSRINVDEILGGCPVRASLWYAPIILLVITFAFNILLNNRPSQWWPGAFAAFVGWGVFLALSPSGFDVLDGNTSVAVASFAVGILGQLFALMTHHQSLNTIICGIIVLVPGGISVRGSASVFTAKGIDGVSFGVTTVMTGFSICMGLIVAKALIPSQSTKDLLHPKQNNPVPIM